MHDMDNVQYWPCNRNRSGRGAGDGIEAIRLVEKTQTRRRDSGRTHAGHGRPGGGGLIKDRWPESGDRAQHVPPIEKIPGQRRGCIPGEGMPVEEFLSAIR